MKKLIHKIAQFIFPSYCVACNQAGTLLCRACQINVPSKIAVEHINQMPVVSAVSYKNKFIKKLLWYGKYKHSPEALGILTGFLTEALLYTLEDSQDFFLPTDKIILIPVPMSPAHLKRRGKNHLTAIIKMIAENYPDQFITGEHLVQKIRHTKTQVECKNRAERLANLKKAFHLIDPNQIKNQTICLVDDIITTGTTLTELNKVVKKGNPQKIFSITIAHG